MNFLTFLNSKSKLLFPFLVILGAISSVFHSGILIVISNTIAQTELPFFPEYDWAIFAGLIVMSYIITRIFQTHIIKLTQNTLFRYEVDLLNKLRLTTFQNFERIGRSKVYTAISDVRVLGQLPENFINIFNSFIVVICCIGYMFWNSVVGGVSVLVVMVAMLIFYLIRNKYLEKDLNQLRDLQNDYYTYLGDFLSGFKEIKMSVLRNNSIYNDYFKPNREQSKKLGINTGTRYMNNELVGDLSWYLVIGVTLFLLPKVANLEVSNTVSFIVTILYLMGPVATLIVFIPTFTKARIAIQRLNNLDDEMGAYDLVSLEKGDKIAKDEHFQSLVFEDVIFQYENEDSDPSFVVGPVNLEFEKGEIVFITGGNGSGKTTFFNILTGLYRPTSGVIKLNGKEILKEDYPNYSDKIVAVFSDSYLFFENYNNFDLNNKTLHELLDEYYLAEKVTVNEEKGRFEAKVSSGQQKRLALIFSLLEDKEIIVLDEWAAEQDPEFRRHFYKDILSELKAKGKTIIAITHDDAYFDCADRMIKFDYGKVTATKVIRPLEEMIIG
ncbi:MAG: cyclic peptide export ABC transporter [Bacteroidota bacterium]